MLTWVSITALLGVLVAAPLVAYRSRRRFVSSRDAFRCRIRTCGYPSAIWPGLTRRWSRPMWAAWEGDVLLVRRGPVVGRIIPVRAKVPGELRRSGPPPHAVCLLVCDGSRMEVATDGKSRPALAGPHPAAPVDDLTRAPLRRRQT